MIDALGTETLWAFACACFFLMGWAYGMYRVRGQLPSCARCSRSRVTTLCLECTTATAEAPAKKVEPIMDGVSNLLSSMLKNASKTSEESEALVAALAQSEAERRRFETDRAQEQKRQLAEAVEAKTLYCPACAKALAFHCPTCVKSHFSGKCTTCFDQRIVRESASAEEKAPPNVTRTRPCPTCCPAPKPLGPQPTP